MSEKVQCPPHANDTTYRKHTHTTTPSAATSSTPTAKPRVSLTAVTIIVSEKIASGTAEWV